MSKIISNGWKLVEPPVSNGLSGARRRYLYECPVCGEHYMGVGFGMASHKGSSGCLADRHIKEWVKLNKS